MISLSDKSSGASVGTMTESQLQILADQLEETDLDDQDYFIAPPDDRHTQDYRGRLCSGGRHTRAGAE